MKAFSVFLLLSVSLGWAQTAPAPSADSPGKVIAIFADGTKMTQGEFQTLVTALPDNPVKWRSMAQRDPQAFLKVYAMMRKASALFRSQNLAEKTPYKEGLDFILMNAMTDYFIQEESQAVTISQEEIQKYYDEHKDLFKRVKVSGLQVAFVTPPPDAGSTELASRLPKKGRTEDEARAKAEKLVAELRGGADFATMAEKESDDENLKAKGGDLGTWGMNDNVPEFIRSNMLALKEGEVSDPIRQDGGYYIVHADQVTYSPLADVKDTIFAQLKESKGRDWFQKFQQETQVEFPKEDPAPPSDPKK